VPCDQPMASKLTSPPGLSKSSVSFLANAATRTKAPDHHHLTHSNTLLHTKSSSLKR
jgi:hypothetical protein